MNFDNSRIFGTGRIHLVAQINVAVDSSMTRNLAPSQVDRLGAGKGRTISCTEGWLWVTRESDMKDYILKEGQSLVLASGRRVFVGSPQGGAYRIS